MPAQRPTLPCRPARPKALAWLHALVLAAGAGLTALIAWDTMRNVSFLASPTYMRVQLWVCLLLMADVVVEFCLSPRKLRYLAGHILFLAVSIPYLNIIDHFGVALSPMAHYLVRFIPLVRVGYVLAIALGAALSSKVAGMFATYLGLLVATVYFASLVFFVEESVVNPGVPDYWSALWWAAMDVTTVGCNISCMTPVGKVLGVVLSAEGLMMFPVFTVYITSELTRRAGAG